MTQQMRGWPIPLVLFGVLVGVGATFLPPGRAAGGLAVVEPVATAMQGRQIEAPSWGLDEEITKVNLPGRVSDVCICGSGRFLLLTLPEVATCAILDVAQRKLIRAIPLPSPTSRVAGGSNCVVVVDQATETIQRWSTETWKREYIGPVELKRNPSGRRRMRGRLGFVAMGSRSEGPLMLVTQSYNDNFPGDWWLVDPQTMEEIAIKPAQKGSFRCGYLPVRASPNGRHFGTTVLGRSPSGVNLCSIGDSKAEFRYEHESPGYVAFNYSSDTVYTIGGRYTNELKSLKEQKATRFWMPSADSDWSFRQAKGSRTKAELIPPGQTNASMTVDGVAWPRSSGEYRLWTLSHYQRVHLFAKTGCIVSIVGDNELQLTRFDPPTETDALGK